MGISNPFDPKKVDLLFKTIEVYGEKIKKDGVMGDPNKLVDKIVGATSNVISKATSRMKK